MRPKSLDEFAGWVFGSCVDAPANMQGVLVTEDDEPGMLAVGIGVDEPFPDTAGVFDGKDYVGMGTRTRWSPDDETPFFDAWLVVSVRRDETAHFAVGPIDGGQPPGNGCVRLRGEDAPWFALSIAAGLRKALDGEPLVFKKGGDERLFHKIGDMDAPPVDADGRI